MSYIGNKPATNFETVQKQISTSNSGTTITLDRAVTSVQDILVTVDAVIQSYDNYSVSGTTLTLGGTLNNNRVEILYVGRTMQSVDPTDDSVSAAKIKTDAVTTAKVQNDAITVDKLNLISTSSVPSIEAKGDGSSVAGKIIWNCENNSHGQTIQAAPHSSGQSWTLKLPDNSPTADKFLKVKSITGSGSTATGQLEFAEGGSNWEKLTESTLSGYNYDTKDDETAAMFSGNHDLYRYYIYDYQPQNDNSYLSIRFRINGTYASDNNYEYHMQKTYSGSSSYTAATSGANTAIETIQNLGNASDERHMMMVEYHRPNTTTHYHMIKVSGISMRNDNDIQTLDGVGYYRGSTNILNGLRFFASAGNLENWHLVGYGLKSP